MAGGKLVGFLRSRLVTVGVVAVVALGIGGIAAAVVPDDDGTLHLCADERGSLRVRDPEVEEQCAEGERELTINRGLRWRGAWDDGVTYAPGDAVQYDGSSFVAALASTGATPEDGSKQWGLLAARGEQGPQGPQGPAGPKGAAGERSALSPVGYGIRHLTGTFAPSGSIRSVVRADGRPFVAYADQGRLTVLSCDATCTTNVRSTPEATDLGVGEIDVAVGPTGLPWVSYAMTSGALRVLQCTNANCSEWTIRNLGSGARDTALLVGGSPTPLVAATNASNAVVVSRCDTNACARLIEPLNLGGGSLPRMTRHASGAPRVLFAQGQTLRWSRCSGTPLTCQTLNSATLPKPITGLDLRTGPTGLMAAVVSSSTATHLRGCGNDCASALNVIDIPTSAPPGRVAVLWDAKGAPSAAVGFPVPCPTAGCTPTRSIVRIVGCPDANCTHPAGTLDVNLFGATSDISLALGSDGVSLGFVRTSDRALSLLR